MSTSASASDRIGDPGLMNAEAPGMPEATPAPPTAGPVDRLYRFSVAQYQKLGRAGIFSGDDRVELIEGLVVRKMTKYERHIGTTRRMVRFVERALPEGWFVGKEDPIILDRSEPEPDVSVLRGRFEDYDTRKPIPADVALVVEVADSSIHDDRRKRAIYAEAGIPAYWIANLNADRIEAYAEPTGPDPAPEYRSRKDYGVGDEIPLVIDGREVARLPVAALLAPARPR